MKDTHPFSENNNTISSSFLCSDRSITPCDHQQRVVLDVFSSTYPLGTPPSILPCPSTPHHFTGFALCKTESPLLELTGLRVLGKEVGASWLRCSWCGPRSLDCLAPPATRVCQELSDGLAVCSQGTLRHPPCTCWEQKHDPDPPGTVPSKWAGVPSHPLALGVAEEQRGWAFNWTSHDLGDVSRLHGEPMKRKQLPHGNKDQTVGVIS